MEASLALVLAVSLLGDIVVFAASTLLLAHKKIVTLLALYATPFAAGALLAAAFLDFLHEGVEAYEPMRVLLAALIGVIAFFLLEGWLHWFHHHSREPHERSSHHEKSDPIVMLVSGGNWLHNFIDGAAIAAAFLVSTSAGVITTIAVALHEIPREVADSGYLLERGLGRRGVVTVHGIAIVATALGTILFYTIANGSDGIMPWLLGSTAGFFIYIAASDIIPAINESRQANKILDIQQVLLVLGAVVVGLAITTAHNFINKSNTCTRSGAAGTIIEAGGHDETTCSQHQSEQLPLCNFDGTRFIELPCFSPDGSLYD